MIKLIIIIAILIALFWWIKRIILRANKTDWHVTWLNFLEGLNQLFCKYYHRLEYDKAIDLPKNGPAIIVSNHLSGIDGNLLIAASRRPIRFLIAREEYERFGLQWLFRAIGCIPVDRSHRPEIALRAALRALKAGEVLAIFPQATFVLPGESRRLKRGSLWLAKQMNCPVYPVHLSGIKGAGHVVRGVLWRSKAKLVTYPPLDLNDPNHLQYLQSLFEAV
jgi:1-acyl-sn-glycerol-3-phosphate acyltransferase